MDYLNDLPIRHSNHEIQEAAESEFYNAINQSDFFLIQQSDKRDYGTDYQIEVKNAGQMTNVRIHIQVKGTNKPTLADSSVAISVARSNLNYLLQQPCSIYVCYHITSRRLLVRYADDILREYEHRDSEWRTQDQITIRFIDAFDHNFQQQIKKRALAIARGERNSRVLFSTISPADTAKYLKRSPRKITVPASITEAVQLINELYSSGMDDVISNAFDQFEAILGHTDSEMIHAYMAEINLGINGYSSDTDRISAGIDFLINQLKNNTLDKGCLYYSIGNGYLALKKYDSAITAYKNALSILNSQDSKVIAAMCYKNMGAAMSMSNQDRTASISLYEKALELNSSLSEAHFALAMCYRDCQEYQKTLDHLDEVIFQDTDGQRTASVTAYRAEAHFYLNDHRSAFRDINVLLSNIINFKWVLPWCARLVCIFARGSQSGTKKAISFWNLYLEHHPDDINAKLEQLLCYWKLKFDGEPVDIHYEDFKQRVENLIKIDVSDKAFLWDRIGHWAQSDANWQDAEVYYRKAYNLEPEKYGYCLGTALNFLNRYEEALPILLDQAENYLPDALSWYQVAVAQCGLNDTQRAIHAYQQAIKFDPDYALAWFNLGGAHWNSGDTENAYAVWSEAITRFPNHELAEKVFRTYLKIA